METPPQKKDRPKDTHDTPRKVPNGAESSLNQDFGIDKVREILMGSRLKEHERQYTYFQSKVEAELKSIRSELVTRVDDLESFIKNEIRDLSGRIRSDHDSGEKSAARLDGALAELRELFSNRTKILNEDFRVMNSRLSEDIKRELDYLSDKKLDRNQFTEFLNEWAMRLNQLHDDNDGRGH